MSQPEVAPNTTALSAYEKNGVIIVETGLSLWITTVVGIIVLCVAIGFGIYVAFKYPAENEDDEDVKRVITGNKVLSIIAGIFIVGLIVWYIVAMAKRSKTWDNERLESEAATLFAHAYGEKAKQLAVGSGGEKLTGFKEAMYGHLMSVFSGENMKATKGFFREAGDGGVAGEAAANQSAENMGNAINASAAAETAAAAAAAEEARQGREAAAAAEARQREEAAAAEEYAGEYSSGTGVLPPGLGGKYTPPPFRSPISLSRASRRRKSPSSSSKKRKASPSSKKKKSPSTKKKSTSSRRK